MNEKYTKYRTARFDKQLNLPVYFKENYYDISIQNIRYPSNKFDILTELQKPIMCLLAYGVEHKMCYEIICYLYPSVKHIKQPQFYHFCKTCLVYYSRKENNHLLNKLLEDYIIEVEAMIDKYESIKYHSNLIDNLQGFKNKADFHIYSLLDLINSVHDNELENIDPEQIEITIEEKQKELSDLINEANNTDKMHELVDEIAKLNKLKKSYNNENAKAYYKLKNLLLADIRNYIANT